MWARHTQKPLSTSASDTQSKGGHSAHARWLRYNLKSHTTFSNGYLGSCDDEERSEMRYVMRIAELANHQIFERTWRFFGSMLVSVSSPLTTGNGFVVYEPHGSSRVSAQHPRGLKRGFGPAVPGASGADTARCGSVPLPVRGNARRGELTTPPRSRCLRQPPARGMPVASRRGPLRVRSGARAAPPAAHPTFHF